MSANVDKAWIRPMWQVPNSKKSKDQSHSVLMIMCVCLCTREEERKCYLEKKMIENSTEQRRKMRKGIWFSREKAVWGNRRCEFSVYDGKWEKTSWQVIRGGRAKHLGNHWASPAVHLTLGPTTPVTIKTDAQSVWKAGELCRVTFIHPGVVS